MRWSCYNRASAVPSLRGTEARSHSCCCRTAPARCYWSRSSESRRRRPSSTPSAPAYTPCRSRSLRSNWCHRAKRSFSAQLPGGSDSPLSTTLCRPRLLYHARGRRKRLARLLARVAWFSCTVRTHRTHPGSNRSMAGGRGLRR